MKPATELKIKDYTYELPEERIAKFPLPKRDESKLLVYKENNIQETIFNQLSKHIEPGTLLVFNNTRVIQARLIFKKPTGSEIELFCIEPASPSDYSQMFNSHDSCIWRCMVGNFKRWKGYVLHKTIETPKGKTNLMANYLGRVNDLFEVEFTWDNESINFGELLHYAGQLPIPPYLNRETEKSDNERYQTVYAKHDGSVAAPTAGLHFTEELLTQLNNLGIKQTDVTLHVGAGTFKPIKSERLIEHDMHEETIMVNQQTLHEILENLKQTKPIISVGTTSTRTLETLYWLGAKLHQEEIDLRYFNIAQWEPYSEEHQGISPTAAIQKIIDAAVNQNLTMVSGTTKIIIAPGYTFRICDGIITNFHQPENSLILLIAAFVGDSWRTIYQYALDHEFRFLSYGDSSLLWKSQ